MPKCSFCGVELRKGTGKMYVYATGKIDYFCGGTCEKQMIKLRRKPLETRWTKAYRQEHKKGMKPQQQASAP